MSQRSMEVKVGVLILVALGLLAGFVVVMGGLSFQKGYTVIVDFDNPGGLKTGAPVRIAGVKVGRVNSMEFRGGKLDDKGADRAALIRVVASIESQFREAIHEDARWFVTTQGVLGEFYLAIDPGTPEKPPLKDGAIVRGISPPRLDLLLSEAYEILHRAYTGITDNETEIRETFDGLHQTLRGTGTFFEKNGDKMDKMVTDLSALSADAHDTLLAARAKYVDSPEITRILHDVEGITSTLAVNLPPLLSDGRKAAGSANKLLDAVASDEQLARYRTMTENADAAVAHAKNAAKGADDLVTHVKQGKGTVGAVVMDEALYDDIQELLRDLKHNPWKLFWRE
ncbi:MAG TPA: MlaD family protein [Polyangiaceae bacterium]|nr:MlaD family protein [Polyangiaceae bacterium]